MCHRPSVTLSLRERHCGSMERRRYGTRSFFGKRSNERGGSDTRRRKRGTFAIGLKRRKRSRRPLRVFTKTNDSRGKRLENIYNKRSRRVLRLATERSRRFFFYLKTRTRHRYAIPRDRGERMGGAGGEWARSGEEQRGQQLTEFLPAIDSHYS